MGLATLIQDSFKLDPYSDSIFLFSGWSKDRYKCLYFDGDGFAVLYKRLDIGKHPSHMRKIANYPKKISDSWPFVVRTVKVRYFFILRAYTAPMKVGDEFRLGVA